MEPEGRESRDVEQPCCGSTQSSCCGGAPGQAEARPDPAASCCCGPSTRPGSSWKTLLAVLIILAAAGLGLYSILAAPTAASGAVPVPAVTPSGAPACEGGGSGPACGGR